MPMPASGRGESVPLMLLNPEQPLDPGIASRPFEAPAPRSDWHNDVSIALQELKGEPLNAYARQYVDAAAQAFREYGDEGLRVQLFYILSNLRATTPTLKRLKKEIQALAKRAPNPAGDEARFFKFYKASQVYKGMGGWLIIDLRGGPAGRVVFHGDKTDAERKYRELTGLKPNPRLLHRQGENRLKDKAWVRGQLAREMYRLPKRMEHPPGIAYHLPEVSSAPDFDISRGRAMELMGRQGNPAPGKDKHYMRTEDKDRLLSELTLDEFHDWLIFQSPLRESAYKAVQILRYSGHGAVDVFVEGMRKHFTGSTDKPVVKKPNPRLLHRQGESRQGNPRVERHPGRMVRINPCGSRRRNIAIRQPRRVKPGQVTLYPPISNSMIATGTHDTGKNLPPFMFVEIHARKGRLGLIAFGAYNAMGLIGPEKGGVALVDEQAHEVLGTRDVPYSRKNRELLFRQVYESDNWFAAATALGFGMRFDREPNPRLKRHGFDGLEKDTAGRGLVWRPLKRHPGIEWTRYRIPGQRHPEVSFRLKGRPETETGNLEYLERMGNPGAKWHKEFVDLDRAGNPTPAQGFQKFHHAAPDRTRRVKVPAGWPTKLWMLGSLKLLILSSGRKIHGGTVCAATGSRIFIVNANYTGRLGPGERATQIEYVTPSVSERAGPVWFHPFDNPPPVREAGHGFLTLAGKGIRLTRRGIVG